MPRKVKPLSINLLSSREPPFGEKFLRWSITIGRYIVIGTEIIVLAAFLSRFKLDRDLIDLNDHIKDQQKVLASFKSTEDAVRRLQARLTQIKTIDEAQGSGLLALSGIAQLTPSEITYKSIRIEGDKVSIIGLAKGTADISRFVAKLKTSILFKKDSVLLEKIERSKKEEEILIFTVSTVVEKEKI